MRVSALSPILAVPGCLVGCAEPDPAPIIAAITVARCPPDARFDELEMIAQGTVVDFLTGAARAGVTVDIARAFEPEGRFPEASCSLARLTTNAQGAFGPLAVKIGPRPDLFDDKYIVFLVQGEGISPIADDARVPTSNAVDRVISAPSLELVDAWRTELDDGGMDNARTGGLILYRYEEPSGTPAAGVTARLADLWDSRDLVRGDEVRYLLPDRQTIAPESRSITTESGLALIGYEPSVRGTREIGGRRGMDNWGSVACLIGEGWLFAERTQFVER